MTAPDLIDSAACFILGGVFGLFALWIGVALCVKYLRGRR